MNDESNVPHDPLLEALLMARSYIFNREHRGDRDNLRAKEICDKLTVHIVARSSSADPANTILAEDVLGEIILHAHDPQRARPRLLVQSKGERALGRRTGEKAVATFRLEEIEARRMREAVKNKIQLPPEIDQ